jgi:hypothetical protein
MTEAPPQPERGKRTDIVIAAAAAAGVVVSALTLLWTVGLIPNRHDPPEPLITLSKNSGSIGTPLKVRGEGFRDGEHVLLFVHVFQVGAANVNDSGKFRARIEIPDQLAQLPLPQVFVFARGVASKRTAAAPFNLTGSSGSFGSGGGGGSGSAPPSISTQGPTTSTKPEETPTTAIVPGVLGQTEANARTELEAQGFLIEVVTAPSDTTPNGIVSAQSPNPGTAAEKGSIVMITVSTGS